VRALKSVIEEGGAYARRLEDELRRKEQHIAELTNYVRSLEARLREQDARDATHTRGQAS
jgi:predicted transcriptional regulator